MADVKKCDSTTRTNLFALSACKGATTSAADHHHLQPCAYSPIQGSSREALGHLADVNDFEFVQLIGRGFFGTVWKVREKHDRGCASTASAPGDNDGILVMKVPITYGQLACHSSVKKIIQREDFMLRRLQHPNILKSRLVMGGGRASRIVSMYEGTTYIQEDFASNGRQAWRALVGNLTCSLITVTELIVDRQRPFPWLHRSFVLRDVCKAMNYVHSLGYMHRDLTSMNVLLQSQPSSKFPKALVADFGLSCRIPRPGEIFQQAGTSNWMSPEMLREEFYNEKSDVFSFGVIACQCFARIDADYDTGLYRTPQFGLDYVRFAVCCPPETPLVLLKIAFMCCLMNPDSRPSFKSLERQFKAIIANWELVPHNSPKCTSPEDIKLERSRSDAAILRGHLTTRGDPDSPSSSISRKHQLNPKRKSVTGNRPSVDSGCLQSRSRCKKDLSLEVGEEAPDGERSRRSSSRLSTPAEQIKELAVSVANIDPSYEESCENPFARHSRYRSVRKMKPPDSLTNTPERRSATFSECHPSPLGDNKALGHSSNTALKVEPTITAMERLEGEEDADAVTSRPRSRSFSLPSSVALDDGDSGGNATYYTCTKESNNTSIIGTPTYCSHSRRHEFRHVLLVPRKTSLTFDTGDERDLRGRMPLSFRDYDQEFNSNYSNTNTHRHGRTGQDRNAALDPSITGKGPTCDFKPSKDSSSSSSTSYDTVCSIGEFEAELELTVEEGVLKSASDDADHKRTAVKNGRDSPLIARRFIPTIPPTNPQAKSILHNGSRYSHKPQTKSAGSPSECRSPTSTNHCCLT